MFMRKCVFPGDRRVICRMTRPSQESSLLDQSNGKWPGFKQEQQGGSGRIEFPDVRT